MKSMRMLLIIGLIASACFMSCSRSRATESGAKPLMAIYRIHINDEMDVSVYDQDGLEKTVVVRPDGMISFPLVGDLYVLGKTTREIRESLEKLLAVHVEKPEVTLLVTRFHKSQVHILGDILAPGPYELTDPYMMYQLLAQARLVPPRMEEHKVAVIRDGKSMPVALKSGPGPLAEADAFALKDGDVIYVSFQGSATVYVLGDVPTPGSYPMPEDASNLIGLLASARALDDYVVSLEVTLIRGGDIRTIPVKSPPEGFELLPNDVILVKPAKKESITVTGHINTPGIYSYVDGQTLLDVITRAGGFSSEAAESSVYIRRNYPSQPETIKAGNLNRTTGDIPGIRPGDVISVPKKKASAKDFITKKVLPVVRDIVIISKVLND